MPLEKLEQELLEKVSGGKFNEESKSWWDRNYKELEIRAQKAHKTSQLYEIECAINYTASDDTVQAIKGALTYHGIDASDLF